MELLRRPELPECPLEIHNVAVCVVTYLAGANNGAYVQTVVDAGAIPLIVALLRNGIQVDLGYQGMEITAASALDIIATNSVNARDMIITAGAIPLLTSLVSQYPSGYGPGYPDNFQRALLALGVTV